MISMVELERWPIAHNGGGPPIKNCTFLQRERIMWNKFKTWLADKSPYYF